MRKLNESLIAQLVQIERAVVRHSESADLFHLRANESYEARRAVRAEMRAKREKLLEGLAGFDRAAYFAIARAEAEATEWRAVATSLANAITAEVGE